MCDQHLPNTPFHVSLLYNTFAFSKFMSIKPSKKYAARSDLIVGD